jgi:DNA repair protein RadC
MPVRIEDVPSHDRPRERLLIRGVEALSERERLTLVLRSGRPGESALDLAGSLIAEFGGLAGHRRCPSRRAGDRFPRLQSPSEVASAARSELAGLPQERVVVLICDSANRLRHVVRVAEGATDRTALPIREILNAVLRHDGRAFAVAHNHPSDDPTPSEADRRATAELGMAARAVGLRFLDHVIVAGSEWGERYISPENALFRIAGQRARSLAD